MKFDPSLHHRRSIRLPSYDYSQAGAYFVTICVQNRECLFGEIVDGIMRLRDTGKIASQSWAWLAQQYDHVELDTWTIMPNHLHGIIVIADDGRGGSRTALTGDATEFDLGGSRTAPTMQRKSIGRLIGAYKTTSTKYVNQLRGTPGERLWQRNYYEHVVRNDADLLRIREYIDNNPAQWELDSLHPARSTTTS